jgi:RNA polymerase sigma-70 factor (ECF subfamily)
MIDDDILRLIFTALQLRRICSLTTAEIDRACLVPHKTIGQPIFRARKTL